MAREPVRTGFVCRGGRMLNEETYENFWDLFRSIPSLEQPGRSVTEEILNFDHAHPTCAKARLVDKEGNILDVKSMGFNNAPADAWKASDYPGRTAGQYDHRGLV